MKKTVLITLGVLCAMAYLADAKTERVICYLGSWATYRNGNGKFDVENINPGLCTHVIYTFLGIDTNGNLKILDPYLEIDRKNLERFNALKRENPKLKTLIAVGGWNEGSIKYSQVAADPAKRATMIQSAINILETYGFDGFDIDWEYPGQRGGGQSDKKNYVKLLKEFREAFDKKGFILTAAVAAASSSVDLSYDVPALSKYLDSINVMAYDLHGSYDGVTGANAPLYPSKVDVSDYAKSLTVDASIRGWLSRGADPQKISMGLPLYGRSFTLRDPKLNGVGAPAAYAGSGGPYTQESGMLGFLEICENHKKGGWTTVWDDNTKTPYTYKGNQWIGYDNEKSIKLKVEYAKSLNLGGVMLWSLETADHKGICGDKYPILSTIKKTLNNDTTDGDSSIEPQPKPDTDPSSESNESEDKSKQPDDKQDSDSDSKSEESSQDSSAEDALCKDVGLIRDPKNCAAFYSCAPGLSNLRAARFVCANGLVFDNILKTCNYKSLVDCNA